MKISIPKLMIYIGLILLSITALIPFALMIVNSTRGNMDILKSFNLIPGDQLKTNYNIMMENMNISDGIFKGIWVGFKNSIIIAVSVTVLSSYFSALTAYGFHIYNFKGKKILFMFILVMMMVPGQLGLLGFYELNKVLKTLNTYVPLIVPAIATPFTVFFLRQYLKSTLHKSLIEAARIDGAKEIEIFHKIVLPMMMPGIATMAIFTFIGAWNNYLVPLVIIFSPEKYPLPVLMGYLKGGKVYENLGAMYTAISISVVPIMIAFAFLSKYIVSNISSGSVKE
ncbi:MAG TPA: sugar ABC transporter permease [Clostridiales bacterium UBA8960]|nr:sugar ABC transporter permease [Clostridiales bacterium UBA8960]